MIPMTMAEARRLARRWPGAFVLFGLGLMRVVFRGALPGLSSVAVVLRQAWQGLPPHASIVVTFLWVMVPVSWALVVGEPWAADRQGWHRFVANRIGARWAWWSGTMVAMFGSALVAVVLLLGGSLAGAIGIDDARWQPTIWPTLGHLAVMLVGVLWPYVALLIALRAITRQPGWALVGTLGLGYLGTIWLAGTVPSIRDWVPPLAGQNPIGVMSDGRVAGMTASYALLLVAGHWWHWRRHGL